MTYSVVAFDADSGAYGVAVQSHWFNVGRSAAWVRFGVGAVATQALTDPSYGWRGLDIMAAGVDAPTTLRVLLDKDAERDRRQVALVDTEGTVAVHTGVGCVRHADHASGEGWAVAGNLLTGPEVIPAMAEAFETATGTLAERMVATLEAAQLAGGDLRGQQSAAIRVVPGGAELSAGHEAGIDILIPDHPDPVTELRRLVEVDRAYRALRRGEVAAAAGDEAEALRQLQLAGSLRHGIEVEFWRGLALARLQREQEAREAVELACREVPTFREVLHRLAEVDPAAEAFVAREGVWKDAEDG